MGTDSGMTVTVSDIALEPLTYVYDGGGRAEAGYRGHAGDCGTRAWAIALGIDYETARHELMEHTGRWLDKSRAKEAREARRRGIRRSVRNGIWKPPMQMMAAAHGWLWVPLKHIGSTETWHLNCVTAERLGADTFVATLSRHYCAVRDGVVRDSHDPRRVAHETKVWHDEDGARHQAHRHQSFRMVYGAWVPS